MPDTDQLPQEREGGEGFTPGPWHTKPGDTPGFKTRSGGAGIYAPARPQDDFFILQIAALETNVSAREAAANAQLIAAAPDLLAVAQWARTCVPYPSDCHTALVAAIAKALGHD